VRIAPPHFFELLMCAAPIYSFYGSWESVGPFVEGAALQEIYSILATI